MTWKIVTFLALVAVVSAEVATITPCDQTQNATPKCTVSEVRITPCPKKRNNECKLKKGTEAQISMDFTPDFTASKLKTEVYNLMGISQVKWADLNDDACEYTACPTEAGKQQQFNYSMKLGKKLPSGTFTFEWQVYDEADKTNMCCFKTSINLR